MNEQEATQPSNLQPNNVLEALQAENTRLREREQILRQKLNEQEALLQDIHQFQHALYKIERELSLEESFDALCQSAIELGRARLGFDRLSLWFYIENSTKIQGSYGTDEMGRLRDERSQTHTLAADDTSLQTLQEESCLYIPQADLQNAVQDVVGEGEYFRVSLWDGQNVIGYLSTDNLLSKKPITPYLQETARLYALTLARRCTEYRLHEARIKAETETKSREELYRKAIRSMGGVVFQYDFRTESYTFMDTSIGELLGYRPEEVTPNLLHTLAFSPEMRGAMKGLTTPEAVALFRSGEIEMWQTDESYVTKSGKLRYFADNSFLLRDQAGEVYGCLGTLQDITERKTAELAFRESDERFRQMAESVDEIFWIFDVFQFRLLYVNSAYSKVWGIPKETLYANPLAYQKAIHPEDYSHVLDVQRRELSGEEVDTVYRIIRPDGDIRWIHHRTYPITNSADVLYRIVGVAADITHQKELEYQLLQTQKMQSIGRIAGGIAHDFNNILTAILGYVELAEMTAPANTPLIRYLNNIRISSERAAGFTSQLLTFARRQIVAPKVVDIHAVIEETVSLISPLLGESTTFVFQKSANHFIVRADAPQIQQVIMNLALNAKDAMPSGGTLTIETRNIHLSDSLPQGLSQGHYLVICVQDTGMGMPDQVKKHIFEPFFTTKGQGKGTGLGLSICYGVIEQHQGSITLESVVDEGTIFTIYLPTTEEAPAPIHHKVEPSDYSGTETILLVEDEAFVRDIAVQTLQECGYRVLSADNGVSAIQLLAEVLEPIHLLVTDIVMPQMSGLELAGRIRQLLPTTKILYMSAHTDSQSLQKQILANEAKFLPKPFHRIELLRSVRGALEA